MAIGRDFASARAGCSLSMSNHPDTCDSQPYFSDVVSIAAMTLRIYLAACHYYGHMADIRTLILTNCYRITNLLLQKFTFTENQTFL